MRDTSECSSDSVSQRETPSFSTLMVEVHVVCHGEEPTPSALFINGKIGNASPSCHACLCEEVSGIICLDTPSKIAQQIGRFAPQRCF